MNNNYINIISRIKSIQLFLKKNNIDGFIQPRSDSYLGEYVPQSDSRLEWISGFSGSAGEILILRNTAILFVDSRYTIQAINETKSTNIKVVLSSEESLVDYIVNNSKKLKNIAFDPWLHSLLKIKYLLYIGNKYNIKFVSLKQNPIDLIWVSNRNAAPKSEIKKHITKYSGIRTSEKIKNLCLRLKSLNVDSYIITQPDAIAWLLNIRGADLKHTPIILTRAIIFKNKKMFLFIDESRINSEIKNYFKTEVINIKIYPENKLLYVINKVAKNKNNILIDPNTTSYVFANEILKANNNNLVEKNCPIELMKAIKNKVEIKGSVIAHKKDGVALSKFLYWIYNAKNTKKSEMLLSNKVDQLRSQQKNFICTSFETISGYASNGAIVHYRVTNQSNKNIKGNSLYLCDSGGQYLEGTTDVTRTIAIGNPTARMIKHFTIVLKAHIALAGAVFPYGTTGNELDLLTRSPLWKNDMHYGHGTGHGVGSCLNVHEGPHRISKGSLTILEPGMVTSNEPGFYLENKYGIRIENLMIVTKLNDKKNKNMLCFKTLTLAPIDTNLINYKLLTYEEINWVNNYNSSVYKYISVYLESSVKRWLKKVCKPFTMAAN
ncbi:aminopeptidase P family protein [Alphaproteobacteria bacterium]|nr:aminopeptidase P family protein [Alphaproteobacteria bacterium]